MASSSDKVRAVYNGTTYSGMLIDSSEQDVYLIKLDNGYNVGIPKKGTKLTTVGKIHEPKIIEEKQKINTALPNISIVSTGGTITSRIDYRTGGVFPVSKPSELFTQIPELNKIANISITSPFAILSEDMTPTHWSKLAGNVARELNKENVRGVIVTHGTDTLHYTAAALSFAFEDLGKPVALVAGQRSSDRGSFDGAMNLACGAHYATSDIAEVAIVMHANSSDDYCIANLGTKVKKMHTSMRNTFRPINTLPLAKIYPNGKIEKLRECSLRHASKIKVESRFEEKVALIKIHPGLSPKILDYYAKEGYKGIILEGTGLGHVAATTWLTTIKSAIKKGIFIGMTSQANYGRVDPYVYATGRDIFHEGVTYLDDMLPETALVKLSWILGQTKSKDKIRQMMTSNLRGEISEKSYPNAFMY
jgi:glutamyl-tRNA(Gln) amidotransferase subunit D|tara:strand:+ start:4332 stop:5591 length:1260 start_codon:yes stop_codon:yes gene_type:complete